jgi:hypothetical protein
MQEERLDDAFCNRRGWELQEKSRDAPVNEAIPAFCLVTTAQAPRACIGLGGDDVDTGNVEACQTPALWIVYGSQGISFHVSNVI